MCGIVILHVYCIHFAEFSICLALQVTAMPMITATQKNLLRIAVESGDSELIAKCISNIKEIYDAIKQIFCYETLTSNGISAFNTVSG